MRFCFSLLLVAMLAGCGGSSDLATDPARMSVPGQGATVGMMDARLPFSTVTPPAFSVQAEGGAEGEVYRFSNSQTGASMAFYIPASAGFQDPVAYAQELAQGEMPTRQRPMGTLDYIFSWTEGDTEVTVYSGVRSGRRYYFRQTATTPADQRALRSILDAWTWLPDGTPLL